MDLMEDPGFVEEIISKHVFTAKAYAYLTKEVEVKYKQTQTANENTKKLIEDLRKELIVESSKKVCKDKREIKRIQRKISKKTASLNKEVCFGGSELLRTIKKQTDALRLLDPERDKIQYEKKIKILMRNKAEFEEARNPMMIFYGDASHKGNRYFDFSHLSEGKVVFLYNKEKININFRVTSKVHYKLLLSLQHLAEEKLIPICVGLAHDRFHITYEEGKINGKFFDAKKFYKTISHIKDGPTRKKKISEAHKAHEKKCFSGKLENRFISIDTNPNGIGWCIADRLSFDTKGEFKIIAKGFIDFDGIIENGVSSDKRKHEIAIAMKYVFGLAEHYKACHWIEEELSFGSNKDNGNRESNRKINNVWLRNLVKQLSSKWCKFYGIKKTEVNPAWSSFIGNVLYDIYDPTAASIELIRRGMVKYIKKGDWMPEFQQGIITDSLLHGNNEKMDYNKLASANSWKTACSIVSTAKMSVRRLDKENYPAQVIKQSRTDKSRVKYYLFL